MGTQISSEISKGEPKRQIISGIIHPNGIELQLPHASYEGIKSEESKEKTRNDSCYSPNDSRHTTSSISDDLDDPLQKFPTKFTWTGEGNTVYVTGNFANWKQWFLMNKSNKHPQKFEITLELPRGTYQYKFIVDKIWKYSQDLPQIKDEHGNINNIINNSELQLRMRESKRRIKSEFKPLEIHTSTEYDEYIPKKCELNCEAPIIPGKYQNPFNMNTQTRQNLIGNPKFLSKIRKNHSYADSSYKSIARAPHVNLNLLASDVKSNNRSGILHIATTTRMKEKYVTYVYYKPIN